MQNRFPHNHGRDEDINHPGPISGERSHNTGKGAIVEIVSVSGYGEVLKRHLPYVLLTIPFIVAARIIPFGLQVTPACMFKQVTGQPCMFCGYTRAFQHLARLDLLPALEDNPASVVLFFFMLTVAIWNLLALMSGKLLLPGRWLIPANRRRTFVGIAIFFVLNWIYRL